MDIRTYTKVTVLNLILVAAGALIAPVIAHTGRFLTVVHAQVIGGGVVVGGGTSIGGGTTKPPAPPPLDPNADYVTPGVSLGGPVVTNTLLANRIASDRLEVNGFEPLRLNDAILSLLVKKGYVTPADVQAVVEQGKSPRPLRIKPAPPQ